MSLPQLLWTPSKPSATQLSTFRLHIASKYLIDLPDYEHLYQWSIGNIAEFWNEVWEWPSGAPVLGREEEKGILASKKWSESTPPWFKGARLNWAENMLRNRSAEHTALIETSQSTPSLHLVSCPHLPKNADEPPLGQQLSYSRMSYAELYESVHETALALRYLGLRPGQILAYYGPTSTSSVVLLLAASSLGAIWSSAAADFGPTGVLERFSQFGDTLWGIVGVNSVRYNVKVLPQASKLATVVDGLKKGRKGELRVVIVDYLKEGNSEGIDKNWMKWEELGAKGQELRKESREAEMEFYQAEFDYPVWVLFSSGTTGKPKPIVHRAGGMLIQSKKEHVLHGDMGPNDVFFYYTTPGTLFVPRTKAAKLISHLSGWMMYNYLVSGLQTGATLVLFDGSPLFRPELLWDMASELGITVFGTSAKYIDVLSKGYSPGAHHPLPSLRQVLSTGSPLASELFHWVYQNIKADINLGSITGGTDICSLFAGHNVTLPVYAGEIQCLGLGMAIESWSEDGVEVPRGTQGDLVCVKPFPCMPAYFWKDEGGKRYHGAYFERFAGVWHHGDFCIISRSREGNGGGLTMLGRSDGVLNRINVSLFGEFASLADPSSSIASGIRFGSSEIYEVLDTLSPTSASSGPNNVVVDSLVVGQKTQGGADERVVLFIQLVEGKELDDALLKEIKLRVRTTRSARHVPERILAVKDIPHTVNGKKVEVPIKKVVNGDDLASINFSTLRNPECLAEYVALGSKLRSEVNK
ncbi:acetoacetyl-CoA synthetase, partial [Phenoliferia sp. Uapishka_3]